MSYQIPTNARKQFAINTRFPDNHVNKCIENQKMCDVPWARAVE